MRGRTGVVVAVAAALVLLLVVFLVLIRPRLNRLGEVREQIQAAEDETQRLRVELQRLEALRENAPELQARLTEVRELVPQDDQVANFIFQVQQAANASGLEFVRITPELPEPPPEGGAAAGLAEVRTVIGAEGGYFSIQDLVRRLYRLDRAVRIDIIGLTFDEAKELLDMEATARIFFEQPAGAAGGAAAPAPAPEQTPAPEETPAPAETPEATPTPTEGG